MTTIMLISGAAVGQLVTIIFKMVFCWILCYYLAKMKYSFWQIYLNRFRYLLCWCGAAISYGIDLVKFYLVPGVLPPKLFSDCEFSHLNEPYQYLAQRVVYKYVLLCFLMQLLSVFALMHDYQTGHYANKSAFWFISSPGQSISLCLVIYYLFEENKKLRIENSLLKAFSKA